MTRTGFSPERLERARRVMRGHCQEAGGEVPGMVTVYSRHGETHVEAHGAATIGGAQTARDTIFRIASLTKPVTAVAVMILVEECVLRLDDPVDEHLPELADRRVLAHVDAALDETVQAHRPITIRDLLTFTYGFGVHMGGNDANPVQRAKTRLGFADGPPQPASVPGPDEVMRRLGSLPLMYQPGERWSYNTGSDVLGVLVARASGRPFDAFLTERVFAPLGMRDTGFSVPAEKIGRLATAYTADEDGATAVYDPAEGGQWASPPPFPSGAGGLVSTAVDYLAFARMLINGGRHPGGRILSRPSVAAMTTGHLTEAQRAHGGFFPDDFAAENWGFGVSVTTRRTGLAGPGAYGWDGGLGTVWRNDPAEDLTAVLLTQKAWTGPAGPRVAGDFLTCAYQAIDD
ncbi:serine hydrolase domain-containing protein [Phytomonospora sp. NPDC050363]|uniref:serine hydrolase domain-containing protein n=1 Tax=Phytomonospora sp. NPDC050363 TaxID=3155642 RepID=UPI0033C3BE37